MILLYMQCLSNGTTASDHPIIITTRYGRLLLSISSKALFM